MSEVIDRVSRFEPDQREVTTSASRVSWHTDLRKNWVLYLMTLPALLSLLVFGYGPKFGLAIAFIDYSPVRGVLKSEWVGLEWFKAAFKNPFFLPALRNTVIIKTLQTVVGFPSAIILALLLNEVRLKWFKRTVQTATMLPFFVSWVVAATMFRALLSPSGVINEILSYSFGMEPTVFLSDPLKFRWIVVFQDTWKFCGYFAVYYLAAMSAIDPTLYEAAMVDGANRWQQTWYITLPGIRPTMVTLFIILTGYLIVGSFEQIYVMYNVSVYSTADILETLTLRLGLNRTQYSLATAVGLFQGIVSFALVFTTNQLAKRFRQASLF